MGDVGITLLKPQYDKAYLRAADTAYWEALYNDGTVYCEAQGAKYPGIDRGQLRSFRIVHNGEIVFELSPPPGRTGHGLIYRRRTDLGQSGAGRAVWLILGLAPVGPFFVIDLDKGEYYEDPNVATSIGHMPGEPADLMPHWTTAARASA